MHAWVSVFLTPDRLRPRTRGAGCAWRAPLGGGAGTPPHPPRETVCRLSGAGEPGAFTLSRGNSSCCALPCGTPPIWLPTLSPLTVTHPGHTPQISWPQCHALWGRKWIPAVGGSRDPLRWPMAEAG